MEGSVQGVGFRYSARREAQGLGLTGWVRNTEDGDVELWAEGASGALDSFLAWLEEGPPGAVVSALRSERRDPTDRYAGFDIEF